MNERTDFTNGYALVVGVGKYQSEGIKDVHETANDALEITRLLKDPSFCAYPEDKVIGPLINEEVVKDRVLKSLDELFEKTVKDRQATVFIYFAGHGVKEKDEYFFLPFDSPVALEKGRLVSRVNRDIDISHTELLDKFNKFHLAKRVKRLIIIFNTCQSGGLLGTKLSPLSDGTRYFQSVPTSVYKGLTVGEGTCFIGASKADQSSWILDGKNYSLFGEKLIVALRGGASSIYANILTVRELTTFLDIEVRKDSKNKQLISTNFRNSDPDFPVAMLRGGQGDFLTKLQLFIMNGLTLNDQRMIASMARVKHTDVAEGDKFTLPSRLIDHFIEFRRMNELKMLLMHVKPEKTAEFYEDKEIPSYEEQIARHSKALSTEERDKSIKKVKDKYYAGLNEERATRFKTLTKVCREVLPDLDEIGKTELLDFLYREGMISANSLVNLQEVDLVGVQMSGFDLSGIDLQGANLSRANLRHCTLHNANLGRAVLNDADFEGAELHGANCRNAELKRAIFNNAQLYMTDFSDAHLEGARFFGKETYLDLTNLERAYLQGADFTEAQIKFVNFKDAVLDKEPKLDPNWQIVRELQTYGRLPDDFVGKIIDADLINADLRKVDFAGLSLINVDFSGADLRGAIFEGSSVEDGFFYQAKLSKVNFKGSTIADSIFDQAGLNQANFEKSTISDSSFDNATLNEANFKASTIIRSTFICSKLNHSKFVESIVTIGTFDEAHLLEANFKESIVSESTFIQAKLMEANFFRNVSKQVAGWLAGVRGIPIATVSTETDTWGYIKRADFTDSSLVGICLKGAVVLAEQLNTTKLMIDVTTPDGSRMGNNGGQIARIASELPQGPYILRTAVDKFKLIKESDDLPSPPWLVTDSKFERVEPPAHPIPTFSETEPNFQVQFRILDNYIFDEWENYFEGEGPAYVIESLEQFNHRISRS